MDALCRFTTCAEAQAQVRQYDRVSGVGALDKMDCAFCEGTGNQPCGGGECAVCGGEGTLADILGLEPRCGRCNGSGKFPGTLNIRCDVCRGTGRIPPETLDDAATIIRIMDRLWEYPDEEVAVFSDANEPLPEYLLGAQWTRRVHLDDETNWYTHPNNLGDHIRIDPNTEWDWQREVMASQPMLRRTLVTLTERERRTRDSKAIAVATDHQQSRGVLNSWVRKNPFWWSLIMLGVGALIGALISWMSRPAP